MKNAVIPKIDGLALGKAAILLTAIAVAGFGVAPVIFSDTRSQTETIAPPSVNPNWLLTPEPAGLDVAREQADLFADEIHRTLIQSEAARIVSKAHSMVGDPSYKDCYGKSIERCFDSIEQSIREEWLTAIEHDEKIRVLFRWQALQVARTGNVEPPVMGLDGTFLQLSDKLAIERNAAMNSSVEGASRFRQIESQLDRINNAPTDPNASPDAAAPPNDNGSDPPIAPVPSPAPTPQPSPAPSAGDPESDPSGDQFPAQSKPGSADAENLGQGRDPEPVADEANLETEPQDTPSENDASSEDDNNGE
jgi:hypothetical protein